MRSKIVKTKNNIYRNSLSLSLTNKYIKIINNNYNKHGDTG